MPAWSSRRGPSPCVEPLVCPAQHDPSPRSCGLSDPSPGCHGHPDPFLLPSRLPQLPCSPVESPCTKALSGCARPVPLPCLTDMGVLGLPSVLASSAPVPLLGSPGSGEQAGRVLAWPRTSLLLPEQAFPAASREVQAARAARGWWLWGPVWGGPGFPRPVARPGASARTSVPAHCWPCRAEVGGDGAGCVWRPGGVWSSWCASSR